MSDIYQSPGQPRYIGTYNWRARIAVLTATGLWQVAATQALAHYWGYATWLGSPLWRHGKYAVYQPLSWVKWYWLNLWGSSPQAGLTPAIGMIILVSTIVIAMMARSLYQQKESRDIQDTTKDLHGSAHWATQKDIEATGLTECSHGVYLGQTDDGRYLTDDGPGHVLLYAPTRSGKGVGPILCTLLGSWLESAVIYDIKGEAWGKTAGFRSDIGLVFRFAPTEEISSRFNPLAEIRIGTIHEVADTQNIVGMLMADTSNTGDPYWGVAAESLLLAMVLHACIEAKKDGRTACLADIRDNLSSPGEPLRDRLEKMIRWKHYPYGNTNAAVARSAQVCFEKSGEHFDSVVGMARSGLALYEDPVVAANTSASDFSVADLVSYVDPISVYFVVPPGDQDRLRPLTRLLFTILANRLCYSIEAKPHRLLLLIDEFPTLKRMELFAGALSYIGGYGLKAFLVAQDMRQIEDRAAYGDKESISSNCSTRIAFTPNNPETAEALSQLTGKATVELLSESFTGPRYGSPSSVSITKQHVERRLLTADELLRLPIAEKKRISSREEIITAPGKSVVFTAGTPPILCTQMLYFQDPVFLERSKIPPPELYIRINDGEMEKQPAITRTERHISQLEKPPPEVEVDKEGQLIMFTGAVLEEANVTGPWPC